ncbi:Heat shock protein DnaJ [Penicillium angulare]|uniref:Heat shock protein DnaJ n=1 Tax=Penicillium angulare TaxID=116970 RepID=UPI00253FB0CB|nr:Heat shock protein DnaJ [Penicillium angulare]KAJ5288461.1 Heat shock protein DnaJ [Penicillium angulare]
MGQSQSAGSKDPESQSSDRKTDYYELLNVTPTATDEEIKKAYRKRALELHPDRNYGNVEEATQKFAEIQTAYEVLADPQERAWYDSHSDAFLGTGGGSEGAPHSYNVRMTTADEVLKVFSQFSPRMEFSDSPTGFFGGLREQFTKLALEERQACQWEGLDEVDYPSFGGRNDHFETVVRPFYNAWAGFSTRKSFAWRDTYRYSEAPDRRVRRLMEKENRRLRDEGTREFNDAVRSLVAFVKKRDPRYQANAQNEAQRQETLRQSAAAQAARSRAMNQAKLREHVVPEWARSEEPTVEEEESSESEVENFECVVCNKTFKSQNQFEAHERSKKHLKAFKQLCREMRAQNEDLDLEPATYSATPDTAALSEDDNTSLKPTSLEERLGSPIAGDIKNGLLDEPARTFASDLEENTRDSRIPSSAQDSDSEPASSHSAHDDDYASREVIQTRLHSHDESSQDDSIVELTEQLSASGLDDPAAPRVGKAKQKRAKKAAQGSEQAGFPCANCSAIFPSRTKLFTHIKENPTHAQLIKTTKTKNKRR